MIVNSVTRKALTWRREARRMRAEGYALLEADWRLERGAYTAPEFRVVDVKIAADGTHLWVKTNIPPAPPRCPRCGAVHAALPNICPLEGAGELDGLTGVRIARAARLALSGRLNAEPYGRSGAEVTAEQLGYEPCDACGHRVIHAPDCARGRGPV